MTKICDRSPLAFCCRELSGGVFLHFHSPCLPSLSVPPPPFVYLYLSVVWVVAGGDCDEVWQQTIKMAIPRILASGTSPSLNPGFIPPDLSEKEVVKRWREVGIICVQMPSPFGLLGPIRVRAQNLGARALDRRVRAPSYWSH